MLPICKFFNADGVIYGGAYGRGDGVIHGIAGTLVIRWAYTQAAYTRGLIVGDLRCAFNITF